MNEKIGVLLAVLLLSASVFGVVEASIGFQTLWSLVRLQSAGGDDVVISETVTLPVQSTEFLARDGSLQPDFNGSAVWVTVGSDWNVLRVSVLELSEVSCDWKARVGSSTVDLSSVGYQDITALSEGDGVGFFFVSTKTNAPASECHLKLDDLNVA